MEYHVVEKNDGIDEDEICKAVAYMKSENEEQHEHNIENMVQDDLPWKIKDATVATGFKMVTYSSDSDEKTAARK